MLAAVVRVFTVSLSRLYVTCDTAAAAVTSNGY